MSPSLNLLFYAFLASFPPYFLPKWFPYYSLLTALVLRENISMEWKILNVVVELSWWNFARELPSNSNSCNFYFFLEFYLFSAIVTGARLCLNFWLKILVIFRQLFKFKTIRPWSKRLHTSQRHAEKNTLKMNGWHFIALSLEHVLQ